MGWPRTVRNALCALALAPTTILGQTSGTTSITIQLEWPPSMQSQYYNVGSSSDALVPVTVDSGRSDVRVRYGSNERECRLSVAHAGPAIPYNPTDPRDIVVTMHCGIYDSASPQAIRVTREAPKMPSTLPEPYDFTATRR
jgi:hypothetical protein